MADLTKLSTDDLIALKSGDLTKVSTEGLTALKGEPESFGSKVAQQVGNVAAGAVRGAGSIGATILSPLDAGARALNDGKPWSVNGYDILGQDRRTAMDQGLQSLGAQPNSLAYKGAKIGAEIAGTAGAGGAVANSLRAVAPGVAAAVPNLLAAIESSGLEGGNLLTRSAGGAVSGAAQTAMVDPSEAGYGAVIGAALPGATQLAGKVGGWVGNKLATPAADPQRLQAAKDAAAAGYVIPPSDIKPQGPIMEALGGLSGKIKTAQEASARNQGVTTALAKKAVGLADDAPITREALDGIRKQAGQAYDAVASTGTIQPGQAYESALDSIVAPFKKAASGFPDAKPNPIIAEIESLKSPQFDASSAVEKIKELRDAANKAYAGQDKQAGKALKSAAAALEDAIDAHLQQIGAPSDMLQAFRDARQLIAKTYSVQGALNGGTGDVSAQALAGQLKRGKPLSGELETIANAGESFPKATQALKEAPKAVSPLDWAMSAGTGMATHNPLALASLLVRPATRSALLSGPVQRMAMEPTNNALINLLQSGAQASQPLLYRSAPVLAGAQ